MKKKFVTSVPGLEVIRHFSYATQMNMKFDKYIKDADTQGLLLRQNIRQ